MSATRVIEWTRPIFEVYGDDQDQGVLPPSRDIYYAWRDDEPNPWLLHYCRGRWEWAGSGLHTLVSREPLHLEASIGWTDCCGRHGFIRGGLWEPAGDGGWLPEGQERA
jgi:hypothetical protein